MYYAIIIVIALALAFIILVRRLPKAMETDGQVFSWPKLTLPKRRRPAILPPTPAPSVPVPPVPAAPTPTISSAKPSFTWPKLRLPSLPKRSPEPKAPELVVSSDTQPSKEDFWAELKQEALVSRAPTKEALSPPPPAPSRLRGRDPMQEAEDAFAIKDYRKAERLYLRIATEDPKNPKVYGRLGVIYLEQKNYEDARDALQVAIKLEPNIASRHFNLALTYLQLDSRTKAITAMENALKYEPSNRKYRKLLDDILARRG